MLKHCHNSSIRLQRRCHGGLMVNPDTVSLNSTVTVHSSCGSSESNTSDSILNSSFQILSDDQQCYNTANNNLYQRHSYEDSQDQPVSMSSRASSYVSLADPGPKTTIKVFASCLRPDIEYKTLSIGNVTTSKSVIWQLLSKYKMKHRDPKLFFLTLEVVIQKPGRDGLTKKTIVLDEDSKPAELKNCNPWGECRFVLQMRKGGVVKVHDSVLMAESQYKCLFISEETTVEEVIKILLHCYGLEKVESAERYWMYEECRTQRYHRKLHSEERPLSIQSLWPSQQSPAQFCFSLSRAAPVVTEQVWPVVSGQLRAVAVQVSAVSAVVSDKINAKTEARRLMPSKVTEGSHSAAWGPHRSPEWNFRAASVESGASSGSDYDRMTSETESWPECDKETEEHISGAETDMDTSLSSTDSPIPPPPLTLLTSTPLSHPSSAPARQRGTNNNLPKPAMSFLFPSPDYASFPNSFVPSRPYSSMSGSTISLASANKISVVVPPSLPPKPSSLMTLMAAGNHKSRTKAKAKAQSPSSFHDYENYFFI